MYTYFLFLICMYDNFVILKADVSLSFIKTLV